jgi:hypothetical protein
MAKFNKSGKIVCFGFDIFRMKIESGKHEENLKAIHIWSIKEEGHIKDEILEKLEP